MKRKDRIFGRSLRCGFRNCFRLSPTDSIESSEDAELGRFLNNFVNAFDVNVESSRGSADALCAAFPMPSFSRTKHHGGAAQSEFGRYRFAVGAIRDGSLCEAKRLHRRR